MTDNNLYAKIVADQYYALNEYQEDAVKSAVYPGRGACIGALYVALKLAGEAGEVAENVGKAIRDDGFLVTEDLNVPRDAAFDNDPWAYSKWFVPERREKIIRELGDVLWYVAAMADELGITLADVAAVNIAKLRDRQERGVIQGSGDDR